MSDAPRDALPLESVLKTEQLRERPTRAADHKAEAEAVSRLAKSFAESPEDMLDALTQEALVLCRAGSAGVSLLRDDGEERFYWPAIAGAWSKHVGGSMPRAASPCGVVVGTRAVQLFANPERHYTYFNAISAPIVEALLVPFCLHGRPVGTLWLISHDERRRFDLEDARLLTSLSVFASLAIKQ